MNVTRGISYLAACCVLAVAVAACSTTAARRLTFQSAQLPAATWMPKVDRFVVIVDDSLSMADVSQGERKIDIARDAAISLAKTIPDLRFSGGLRSFGQGGCLPRARTSLLAGMAPFSAESFVAAAGRVACPNGTSPLDLALRAAGHDLDAPGKAALILITDGLNMGQRVVDAAARLKSDFGSRLCIFVVQVGDDRRASALLSEVATGPDCGGVVGADELTSARVMAGFVERALLLPDSDGDGVPDGVDHCPGTPAGIKVDARGCPPDSDGDGVPDDLDKCPDTAPGVAVDREGCPRAAPPVPTAVPTAPSAPAPPSPPGGWSIEGNVLFDTDRAEVKAAGRELLVKVADFLKANPQYVVEIQGHTDSTGTHDHNMTLSQERANSVLSFLVAQGVDARRLTAVGLGPDRPIASNETPEGRAQNRRVDLEPTVK